MTRKEVTEKLCAAMDEIEEVYRKHGCVGVFIAYMPGHSGFRATPEGGVSYNDEGQCGIGTPIDAEFSVFRKLSEVAPDHPALAGGDVYILGLKSEEADLDKDQLRVLISPTINMARTLALFGANVAALTSDMATGAFEMAKDLGVEPLALSAIANLSTGEGIENLPPEPDKNSMH